MANHWGSQTFRQDTILVLLAIRLFLPRAPSSLAAVILGIVLSSLFHWKDLGIKVVGELKQGLPSFGMPRVSWADVEALLPGAASMALLAFSDTILTGRSFAARHGYSVDANRELFALGAANVGTALSGGFRVPSVLHFGTGQPAGRRAGRYHHRGGPGIDRGRRTDPHVPIPVADVLALDQL
jgi:SulP family sulfate permease